MTYPKDLIQRLEKWLRGVKTSLPDAPGGSASTYRPVNVSPKPPVAPEGSPASPPRTPPVVDES